MKGIRAIKGEGWYTALEREDVHNASGAASSSWCEEIFAELLPFVFTPNEAHFELPLIVAFPAKFLPPGGQVFHTSAITSGNVSPNSFASR